MTGRERHGERGHMVYDKQRYTCADWMALTNFSFDYSPFDSLLLDDIFDFRSSGSGLLDEFSRFGDGILKDDYDYGYLIANLGDDLGLGFGFRVSNLNFSNLFPNIRDIFSQGSTKIFGCSFSCKYWYLDIN
ncbi:hypothetical protein NL676_018050 [Syzygium grande]|nr:hypothetical protein NL676_018050 [Syzygium grande]